MVLYRVNRYGYIVMVSVYVWVRIAVGVRVGFRKVLRSEGCDYGLRNVCVMVEIMMLMVENSTLFDFRQRIENASLWSSQERVVYDHPVMMGSVDEVGHIGRTTMTGFAQPVSWSLR